MSKLKTFKVGDRVRLKRGKGSLHLPLVWFGKYAKIVKVTGCGPFAYHIAIEGPTDPDGIQKICLDEVEEA